MCTPEFRSEYIDGEGTSLPLVYSVSLSISSSHRQIFLNAWKRDPVLEKCPSSAHARVPIAGADVDDW